MFSVAYIHRHILPYSGSSIESRLTVRILARYCCIDYRFLFSTVTISGLDTSVQDYYREMFKKYGKFTPNTRINIQTPRTWIVCPKETTPVVSSSPPHITDQNHVGRVGSPPFAAAHRHSRCPRTHRRDVFQQVGRPPRSCRKSYSRAVSSKEG